MQIVHIMTLTLTVTAYLVVSVTVVVAAAWAVELLDDWTLSHIGLQHMGLGFIHSGIMPEQSCLMFDLVDSQQHPERWSCLRGLRAQVPSETQMPQVSKVCVLLCFSQAIRSSRVRAYKASRMQGSFSRHLIRCR